MEKPRNRQELAKMFAELGCRIGAEIGVCCGHYSKTLCEANPQAFIYGIDSWAEDVTSHTKRNISGEAYAEALANLSPFIEAGKYEIIKQPSMKAVGGFQDGMFDFVYIDAGHRYNEVKEDIEGWTEKVKKGGIVSGDDYYEFRSGKGGIIPAVNEYVAKHGYDLQIIGWDNKNPDRDSRQPNWWFIKR